MEAGWFDPKGKYRMLDYGCGRGDDVRHLRELGYKVVGYDPYWQDDRSVLKRKYDIITCQYVFNVIEDRAERLLLQATLYDLLKPEGMIFISVRRGLGRWGRTSIGTWQGYIDFNLPVIMKRRGFVTFLTIKADNHFVN